MNKIQKLSLYKCKPCQLIASIAAMGVILSFLTAYYTDRSMRSELLQKITIISKMIPADRVLTLSGSEADRQSADYLRLKTLLMEIRQGTTQCRFVYLLGRNSNGKIFFYADSEPAGSKDESSPGQFYDEASEADYSVFSKKTANIEGPSKDRWGTWVSAIVPIYNANNNKIIALGMDTEAKEWMMAVASRAVIPAVVIAIILVFLISIQLAKKSFGGIADEKPVLRRLMIPLVVSIFILVSSFCAALVWQYKKNLDQSVSSDLLEMSADFSEQLQYNTEKMSIEAESIASDTLLFPLLKYRDREKLLSVYSKCFDTIRNKHGITYFSFHDANLVNILRLHKYDEYGDIITRFTANKAKETGKTVSGLEIGTLETFTLKVVQPVFEGSELIGFVELGRDIGGILERMPKSGNVDVAVIIFKEKLAYEKWKSGIAAGGLDVDWNRLPNDVLVYFSNLQLPAEFNGFLIKKGHTDSEYKFDVTSKDATYMAALLPIKDARGVQIGHLLAVSDITKQKTNFMNFLIILSSAIFLLISLIFGFIYIMLNQTDKGIEVRNQILRESGERLKEIVNAAQDGIIMLNSEGCIVMWNSSAERLFGYTSGQILGSHLHKLFPERFHEDHRLAFKAFRRSVEGNVVEMTTRRNNNEEFPAELSFSVVQLQGEWHTIVIVRDITERKQAESKLRQNEAVLSSVFAAAPISIVLTKKRVINKINGRLSEITGYSIEELIGKSSMMLYPNKEEYERVGHAVYDNLGVCDSKSIEAQWQRKDGKLINVLFSASLFNSDNQDAGEIVTITDITERKQAEIALRQSEERLKTIVHAAQDGIIMLNPDGKISMWNESAERIFGYSVEQVLNKNIHTLLAPGRFHKDYLRGFSEFRRTGQGMAVGRIVELYALRKDGEEIPIELSLSVVQMQDGWYSIGVVRDITERKRVEERLKNAVAESVKLNKELEDAMTKEKELAIKAETANKTKSQFLANMSHEIRTPMNAIIGFSDLLAEDILTDEQLKNINIIREAGHNLLKLVNDILDLSKIEAGKLSVEIADCELDKLLISVESLMKLKAREKGLEFKVIYGGNLPAQIKTDSVRLHQCLVNLAGNAVKFTQNGHIYLTVSLETEDRKPLIRFDIEDTGIGIPPEKQEIIFEAFEQADGSHTRKYGGTGLGLSITKYLAGLLGGRITLKSQVGKGSVFSLFIPAGIDITTQSLLSHRNISCVSHLPENKKEAAKYSGSILVAEDAPTNQVLIRALLQKLGLNVTITGDGRDAVHKATEGHYDLIFMDIQMPVMNGYEATRLIRKTGIKTPIIALTANVIKGDDQKCIEAGCNDYLSKPIERKELLRIMNQYLVAMESDSAGGIEPGHKKKMYKRSASGGKAVINWPALIGQCGDEDVANEIVNVFLAEAPKYISSLSKALKKGNAKDIAFFAHKLKGSAAYITAGRLVEKTQKLETAGRNQDMEEAGTQFEKVRKEFIKVSSFLSQPDWDKKAKQQSIKVKTRQIC